MLPGERQGLWSRYPLELIQALLELLHAPLQLIWAPLGLCNFFWKMLKYAIFVAKR